jgi:hypothetical protein
MMNLQVMAGKMALFMAVEAYRALQFSQAIQALPQDVLNTEQEFIVRVLVERDLFAEFHRSPVSVMLMTNRFKQLMVQGPARVAPSV